MELKVSENPFSISFSQNNLIDDNSSTPLHKQPFAAAILYLKEMLKELSITISQIKENSEESCDPLFDSSLSIDTLHFGIFLNELNRLKEEGLFLNAVHNLRDEIHRQKEHWRPYVDQQKTGENRDFYSSIENILTDGKLIPDTSGCGSAYFLIDVNGIPRYVVKPVDEDIFCLNNRKEFASVFNDFEHRVRNHIPLYRSAQTDAFCWDVALLAGLERTTPKAVIGILKDDGFYDFTHWIEEEDKEKFATQSGYPDREKLSSIQEYIPDSKDLTELLHDFYQKNLSDEEIASHFDQKDFEEVCMFLWLSYDNDAHGSNFLTFLRRIDENQKKIYGIKKIDNGLSYPEKNSQYASILTWVPNALCQISSELKQKIANLPVEQILKRMDDYELSNCKEAFKERVEILKELSQREGVTVGEIDLRFTFLSYEGGKELALNPMSTQEIIDLLLPEMTSGITTTE